MFLKKVHPVVLRAPISDHALIFKLCTSTSWTAWRLSVEQYLLLCLFVYLFSVDCLEWNVYSVLKSLNADFWNHLQYQILAWQCGNRRLWTNVVLWGHKHNDFLGLPSNQVPPVPSIFSHLMHHLPPPQQWSCWMKLATVQSVVTWKALYSRKIF
jgi:hypothetical protein